MKSTLVSLLLLGKETMSSGWDYADPAHWSETYSMCDNEDESPIDIITDNAVHDTSVCGSEFEWDVDFTHETFKIWNNGHSIVLKAVEETDIDPDHDLDATLFDSSGTEYITLGESDNTIATFPNYFQPEDSEHDSFCLDSLHFHWGLGDDTGSEHLVDGNQYPLEVHFVHYSCAHSSLGSTLTAFPNEGNVSHYEGDRHQLGVVGIFFDIVEDESNPAFDAIFEQLENIAVPKESNSSHIVTGLDLEDMIPEDLTTAGYYAYEGSLTTPPCTNIVRWHVMNARSWIGASQMEHFRELLAEEDHQIAPNYRPVQENVNTVYACMEAVDDDEDDATIRAIVWTIAGFSILAPIILGVVCCRKAKAEQAQAEEENPTKKGGKH